MVRTNSPKRVPVRGTLSLLESSVPAGFLTMRLGLAPLAFRVMLNGVLDGSLLLIVRVAVRVPVADGVKVTANCAEPLVPPPAAATEVGMEATANSELFVVMPAMVNSAEELLFSMVNCLVIGLGGLTGVVPRATVGYEVAP